MSKKKIEQMEYTVDIDLCAGEMAVCTYDCAGEFHTLEEAMNFAKAYAKNRKNFKKKWLKEHDADEIILTIRENYEWDENGRPSNWDDVDCVTVDL